MKRTAFTILALVLLGASGCNTGKNGSMFPWEKKDEKAVEEAPPNDEDLDWSFGLKRKKPIDEPVKMFVTWTDSIYTLPGSPATRGFAARIYFYNKNYEPIEVDGSLVIYGFDDTDDKKAKRSADKKFVFEPAHLASRHSVTKIGPSYSVWVPWDRVGSEQKSISLVPVFRTSQGQIVRGEQVVNVLRGKPRDEHGGDQDALAVDDAPGRRAFQQVAYEGELGSAPGVLARENAAGMKTTTISVPRSTMRHLKAPLSELPQRQAIQLPQPPRYRTSRPQGGTSSHYIFDNRGASIQPRSPRRYAEPNSIAESNAGGARFVQPAAVQTAQLPVAQAPAAMFTAGAAPAASTARQRIAHSEPQIHRAQAGPAVPPGHAPAHWEQYRAIQPFGQPTSPR